MSDKLVTVVTFNFPIEAEMAKLRLESEGIECVLANEILARLDGPVLEIYPIKAQVRAEDAERAAKILREERELKG